NVLGRAPVRLELHAAEAGAAGVSGDAAEGLDAAHGAPRRSRYLHVLVLGVENGGGELQPVIEQGRLPARFIAGDLLGLEGHEVEDVLRRLRGRLARLAARVEAAPFEALRVTDVDVVVGVRL